MEELILTESGYKKLEDELQNLVKIVIPEIKRRMITAREDGDLSENHPWITAKEDMDAARVRVAELKKMLRDATLVKKTKSKAIALGDKVDIEIGGAKMTVTMVSSLEADPVKQMISPESPLGQVLIGQEPGETVTLVTPNGEQKIKIVSKK